MYRAGIYCIECLVDSKKYIGQSIDVFVRLKKHKRILKNNKHPTRHLQSAWNKYGESNFVFYTLEFCELSKMNQKEVDYISKHNSTDDLYGYNLQSGGNNYFKHSEETIALQRKLKSSKRVYGFDSNGELKRVWESIKLCARELSANPCDVRRTISQQQIICKGFILNNEPIFRIRENKRKYNLGNFTNNKILITNTNYVTL
jgi:group I intron endonuclease